MNIKKIVTWIGVVSGLLTIIWSFGNPFTPKPELDVYVTMSEYLNNPKNGDSKKEIFGDFGAGLTKVSIRNTGDKVATKIHVDFKSSYRKAISNFEDNIIYYKESDPIYIDSLEPGKFINFYFWSYFSPISSSRLNEELVISSPDVGIASLRTDIKGTGFIWYVSEYWFIAVGLLGGLITALYNGNSEQNKKKETSEVEGGIQTSDLRVELQDLSYAWDLGLLTDVEFKDKGRKIVSRHEKKEQA